MALVAEDAADRAQQLVLLTERLTALIAQETALIDAREPPLSGPIGEEKARLANLSRQEMTRIAETPGLIQGAPARTLDLLRAATTKFRAALADHERALRAVKEVSEGLVRAIAEEIARVKGGPRGYGATGAYAEASTAPAAALALNKTA